MRKTFRRVPVSELPPRLREGRSDADFVNLVIEDAPAPSDADRIAILRHGVEEADEDVRAGRVHDADDVFAEIRAELEADNPR